MSKNWTHEDIFDNGERVSHLCQDGTFYGHLAIYDFATQFCQGADVLDVGSGAGYGSAYLAEHGARSVHGVEISPKAVQFSRENFKNPNLNYSQMPAEEITGFQPQSFDVIYTSNVLEHVEGVDAFMRTAWTLLKPTGLMILAVPPITDERLEYLNIINPYHVNIWSPKQWHHAINRYFAEITPYLHGVEKIGCDFTPEHYAGKAITEKSFVFEPATVDDMYKMFTLTAIFLVKKPRAAAEIPAEGTPVPFIDDSYTRGPGIIPSPVRQRLDPYFKNPPSPILEATPTSEPTPSASFMDRIKGLLKLK